MIKCSNTHIIGIPGGEGKEWDTSNIWRHTLSIWEIKWEIFLQILQILEKIRGYYEKHNVHGLESQCCKDVICPQINLKIQCNHNQISRKTFCGNLIKYRKMYIEKHEGPRVAKTI